MLLLWAVVASESAQSPRRSLSIDKEVMIMVDSGVTSFGSHRRAQEPEDFAVARDSMMVVIRAHGFGVTGCCTLCACLHVLDS